MAEIRICRAQRLRHGATSRRHCGAWPVPDPSAQLRAAETSPTRTVLTTNGHEGRNGVSECWENPITPMLHHSNISRALFFRCQLGAILELGTVGRSEERR